MSSAPVDPDLLDQLTQALADLTWTSETDAPFDVALWQGLDTLPSDAQLLEKAQLPPETAVEQLDLKTFLDPVIHPLYPPESPAVTEQFQAVQDLLLQNLQQVRVYRCGVGEIELYILGQTIREDWIVIHTAAVET